ncbi:MAG TPA: homocysteine S-methyltransferase family protein [Chloroflexota bacterium]|nr:homocysteine S-methyltransferase family protein [Chloroflexota bacterium]
MPSDAYSRLRARLERSPVVLDAPVGAELVRRGVRWRKHGLLTDADAVRRAHVDYLRAGADLTRTNTFGLNRRTYLNVFRSPEHMAQIGAPGLATLHLRLLRRAVEVAREARDQAGRPDAPIAGVLSTLEHVFRPDLAPSGEAAEGEHAEIARTLAEAGVEMLVVEAMTTLAEARHALAAARATGLPLWASFAVDERGDLLGREPLVEAVRLAQEGGAEAVVVTGGLPQDVERGFAAIQAELRVPGGVAPMCGRFDPPSWKFEFHPQFALAPPPDHFAERVRGWIASGARVVGAWCGATPEHVVALRRAVDAPAGAA